MTTTPLGDYVFYGDESGDPNMQIVAPEYPAFALTFCAFSKRDYINHVTRQIKSFKFAYWGHETVVLHGKKIRRKDEDFVFLRNKTLQEQFLSDLTLTIRTIPFTIISTEVDKRHLQDIDCAHPDLYDLFFEITLKKIYLFLEEKQQQGKVTHLVIESRTFHDNQILARAFQRILEENKEQQDAYPVQLVFVDKRTNCLGLQVADLVAYPIARKIFNREEKYLSFEEIVKPKLYRYRGIFSEEDSLLFPKKQKTPDFSEV
jgi:hypothetical protein